MLFMFHTRLRRPSEMPAHEFYAVWEREAVASIEAVEAGIIKHIWKVAGKDEVIGVMDLPDADSLDQGLHSLPLWKSGNSHCVQSVEWTVLRSYENWGEELKELAKPGD